MSGLLQVGGVLIVAVLAIALLERVAMLVALVVPLWLLWQTPDALRGLGVVGRMLRRKCSGTDDDI